MRVVIIGFALLSSSCFSSLLFFFEFRGLSLPFVTLLAPGLETSRYCQSFAIQVEVLGNVILVF